MIPFIAQVLSTSCVLGPSPPDHATASFLSRLPSCRHSQRYASQLSGTSGASQGPHSYLMWS